MSRDLRHLAESVVSVVPVLAVIGLFQIADEGAFHVVRTLVFLGKGILVGWGLTYWTLFLKREKKGEA